MLAPISQSEFGIHVTWVLCLSDKRGLDDATLSSDKAQVTSCADVRHVLA